MNLELVLLVLGSFVERPIIAKLPDMVDLVEALDVVGHPVPLQDILTFRDWTHSIDLQI